MCTELVVASFSVSCLADYFLIHISYFLISIQIWMGLTWGILYCMIERVDILLFSRRFVITCYVFYIRSISAVFQDLHDFNIAEVGTVFMAMV
jgi:hypothetical protein